MKEIGIYFGIITVIGLALLFGGKIAKNLFYSLATMYQYIVAGFLILVVIVAVTYPIVNAIENRKKKSDNHG